MSTIDNDTAQLVKDLFDEESGEEEKQLVKAHDDEEKEQTQEKTDKTAEPERKVITLPEKISVKDLGSHLGVEPVKIIKKLMDIGLMVNIMLK